MNIKDIYYVLKEDIDTHMAEKYPDMIYGVNDYYWDYGITTEYLGEQEIFSLQKYLHSIQLEFSTLFIVANRDQISQQIRKHINGVITCNLSNLQYWYQTNPILLNLHTMLQKLLLRLSVMEDHQFTGTICKPKDLDYEKINPNGIVGINIFIKNDSSIRNGLYNESPIRNKYRKLKKEKSIIPANYFALLIFLLHKLENEQFYINESDNKQYLTELNLYLIQGEDFKSSIINLDYINNRYTGKKRKYNKDVKQLVDISKVFGIKDQKGDRFKKNMLTYVKEHSECDKLSRLIDEVLKKPDSFFFKES